VATKSPTPAIVPPNVPRNEAKISVGGLKPGQKIRVIVKVNVKAK